MRIPGVPEEQASREVRELYRQTAERAGRVTIPLTVLAHRAEIADAFSTMNRVIGAGIVEPRLKLLGCIRIAQMIGCPF
jgi:seryl-tRNA(Sec) selenium transferase